MKTKISVLLNLLLLLVLRNTAVAAASDGYLTWGNNPLGFRAPIYGPNPADPFESLSGQSSIGNPSGSTLYSGPLLQGSGYTFAIFVGPTSASSNSLTLLASTTFRTAVGDVLPAGLVVPRTDSTPAVQAGNQAHFQIRVWDNQGGTIADWGAAEAAWLAGLTDAGVSPIVTSDPLGGTDSNFDPLITPIDSGWESFNTHYIDTLFVPEPSLPSLGGLGAAALMIFRRRK